MKNKIILTIGASCSGKTTWTREYINNHALGSVISLNRDGIRFMLFTKGIRDWTKYKFNNKNERAVTEYINSMALECIANGSDIIISDTNLNPKIRNKWKQFADEHDYEYVEQIFPCDWKELVKRNAQRQGGLSESLLWSQYKRFMQQYGYIGDNKVEVYQEQRKLEHCIIVDIDGTLADMQGVRKPFEWDKVHLDKPRSEIIAMVEGLAIRNGHIIFMSGRDGSCYDSTLEWIETHITAGWDDYFKYDLIMREEGDMRKDDIVKYELYNQYVKDAYNVAAVIDDRKSIIRLWSVLELPNIIDVGGYQNEF